MLLDMRQLQTSFHRMSRQDTGGRGCKCGGHQALMQVHNGHYIQQAQPTSISIQQRQQNSGISGAGHISNQQAQPEAVLAYLQQAAAYSAAAGRQQFTGQTQQYATPLQAGQNQVNLFPDAMISTTGILS